ncbi:hypothetical protein V491_08453 [Pseudogymnoascus sp. VKM F-3775]|nr:hypothetical protein V491_08453 [Pseudogymnoascus sp. VKM F-3775]
MMRMNCEGGEKGNAKGAASRVAAQKGAQNHAAGVQARAGRRRVTTIHETTGGDATTGIGTDTVTETVVTRVEVVGEEGTMVTGGAEAAL